MDKNLFKKYLRRNDDTQQSLADAMGLSLSSLNKKINETYNAEFWQSEILFVKERWDLSPEEVESIFFVKEVS